MLFEKIKMLNKNFEVEKDMYIQVEGENIVYVGKEKPQDYQGETYDGTNKVIMPGLYNMHCHIPMVIMRGYGSGLPLEEWLFTKNFPFEAQLTAEDIVASTKVGMCELISSGCCSFQDMFFQSQAYGKAVYDAGMKANISESLLCGEDDFEFKKVKGFDNVLQSLEMEKNGEYGDRVRIDAAVHSVYTSSDKYLSEFIEWANSNNMIKQTHMSETLVENKTCTDAHNGKSPAQVFEELGLFDGNKTIVGHGVHIDQKDIDILVKHNVGVVRCFSSNLKLGSGIAPLRDDLVNNGLEYVGTDGASSNNNLNMFEELHLTAMVPCGYAQDPNAATPQTVLKMATIDSAKAQGRENCGYIDEGMKADMVVVDLDKPHMQPDTDTLYNLLYSAQSSDVCLNMIDGKILYKNGEFLTIDWEKAVAEMNASFDRIVKIVG